MFNGLNRQLYPTDIFLITTGLYLVTPYGNAYRAKFDKPAVITTDKSLMRKNSTWLIPTTVKRLKILATANQVTSTTGDFAFTDRCRFLHWPSCYQFGLTYIPAIHRCIRVFSPPDGKNVAFLQQHPAADLTELPMVSPSEMSQNFRFVNSISWCIQLSVNLLAEIYLILSTVAISFMIWW